MLLLSIIVSGQVLFNNTYFKPYWDMANAVIERQDGKYLIAGSSRSQAGTNYDVNFLLVDSVGNLIWDKYLGVADTSEFAYSLIETSDNNYLISGRIGNYFPYMLKFDANGTFLWDNRYGSNGYCLGGFSIGETADTNYYFVRPDYSFNSTMFFKTDSQGDTLWTKSYNSLLSLSVVHTSDSGFALIGKTNPTTLNQEIFLIKTNSVGDTLWTKTFGGNGNDDATSIQQLPDNGYIIAGIFDVQIPDEEPDTYIIRTDSNGNTIWTKRHFHLGVPEYIKKCFNNNGYILSTTRLYSPGFSLPDEHYLIITKLDTLGNIQWSRLFDGEEYALGNNVTQTSDGGFLLTGHIQNFNNAEIILIKLDSIGNFVLSTTNILNPDKSQVSVYPNPTTDEINFVLHSISTRKINQVAIFNFIGQEIKSSIGLSETKFKEVVGNFPSGLYFYKLTTSDNQTLTGKFIVKQ